VPPNEVIPSGKKKTLLLNGHRTEPNRVDGIRQGISRGDELPGREVDRECNTPGRSKKKELALGTGGVVGQRRKEGGVGGESSKRRTQSFSFIVTKTGSIRDTCAEPVTEQVEPQ